MDEKCISFTIEEFDEYIDMVILSCRDLDFQTLKREVRPYLIEKSLKFRSLEKLTSMPNNVKTVNDCEDWLKNGENKQ